MLDNNYAYDHRLTYLIIGITNLLIYFYLLIYWYYLCDLYKNHNYILVEGFYTIYNLVEHDE